MNALPVSAAAMRGLIDDAYYHNVIPPDIYDCADLTTASTHRGR